MKREKMRKSPWASPVFAAVVTVAASAFVGTGCTDYERVSVFSPIYLSYAELRAPVMAEDPVDIGTTGKIYVKDSYIYVNELYDGIHVIDNTDPSSPQKIAFIPIPGNVDMAITGTTLYADSYVDLVAVDVANPLNAVEVARIEDAFPYMTPSPWIEEDFVTGSRVENPDESIGVVVGWEMTRTERVRADHFLGVGIEGAGDMAAPVVMLA